MQQWSKETAIIWHNQELKYKDVLKRVNFWENQVSYLGVSPGSVIGLEGNYSPNACALLLALIQRKAIVVPLTKAVRVYRDEFLSTAEVQLIFTFDDEDNWQIEKRAVEILNPLTKQLIEGNHPGLILFSSGSTGKNKAALHNFNKFLGKFKVPRLRMRTINFLLFDHIGGLNTLFYTLFNGGTVVTTQDRDPESVCELIEKHKVELLPTTPTFLNIFLISEAYRNFDLSSLRLITYGTEVMSETVLTRIRQIFPNVRLLQTYGSSELGILRSKSKDSDSAWMKVGGESFEIKVVDGILWIRADSPMIGYLNAPNPFTQDGWFITGDAVEVDGEYIRVLGRKSEIINVGGEKVYPAEVETVLQMMDAVEDVAVSAESNAITGQIVNAQVRLNSEETVNEFTKRMQRFCRGRLSRYKIPQKVTILSRELYGERFKKRRND